MLIDVPKDVQNQVVEVHAWPAPGRADPGPAFALTDVAPAAELINTAARPILYIGGGVIHAGAAPLVTRLAEKAGIPTTMTLMGLGAVPMDHPRAIGMLGMHAARYTNLALEACDLLVAAGVRFDDRATGKVAAFCPKAYIVHIDIDPSELDKIKTAQPMPDPRPDRCAGEGVSDGATRGCQQGHDWRGGLCHRRRLRRSH